MAILIVNKNKNVDLGNVKMLNQLIILISYVDNLRVNVQLMRLIMVVFRDYNNVQNTKHNINVLVYWMINKHVIGMEINVLIKSVLMLFFSNIMTNLVVDICLNVLLGIINVF